MFPPGRGPGNERYISSSRDWQQHFYQPVQIEGRYPNSRSGFPDHGQYPISSHSDPIASCPWGNVRVEDNLSGGGQEIQFLGERRVPTSSIAPAPPSIELFIDLNAMTLLICFEQLGRICLLRVE